MKIDVWDFGAAQLDEEKYENWLNAEVINHKFYGNKNNVEDVSGVDYLGDSLQKEDTKGNLLGVNVTSFTVGDLTFYTDRTNNRLRAKNSELSRFDDNADVPEDVFMDETIKGCLYLQDSDGRAGQGKYFMSLQEGDLVTCYVRFDRADDDLVFWLEGKEEARFPVNMQGGIVTFVAKESGRYEFTNGNDAGKLKIYRITREHATWEKVTGKWTLLHKEGNSGNKEQFAEKAKLVLINKKNLKEYAMKWKGDSYEGEVPVHRAGDGYELALRNVETYVITSDVEVKAGNSVTVDVREVNVQKMCGEIVGVEACVFDEELWQQATFELIPQKLSRYVPKVHLEWNEIAGEMHWWALLERGMKYELMVQGLNDYQCETKELQGLEQDAGGDIINNGAALAQITFVQKKKYVVQLELEGLTEQEKANAEVTFTNINEGMAYTFSNIEGISLRNGVYRVEVLLKNTNKKQKLTSYLKVQDAAVEKQVRFEENAETSEAPWQVAYQEKIKVGQSEAFQTIGAAIEYVEHMHRKEGQEVIIEIEPGNYEEMLTICGNHITLRNAAKEPSIELCNAGVDIDENAVRITSYYGHGCRYYSQGPDGKYNEEVLRVNKENGWISNEVAGDLTKLNTYWNATVVVYGSDFHAEGIIFENSFNQYISKKEAGDVVELLSDNRGGVRPTVVGNTGVQDFSYLERAAAVALTYSAENVSMTNCRFVGRQDVLYGDRGVHATFEQCKIMGSIDYIFGGMEAQFSQCELILNTSDDSGDIAYITAPQTAAGKKGFFMEHCLIRSAVPGVENASKRMSHPGYFGRPWSLGTAQAVYAHTRIGWTNASGELCSIIASAGWDSSLSGESERCGEYDSIEELTGETPDYEARVAWAKGKE